MASLSAVLLFQGFSCLLCVLQTKSDKLDISKSISGIFLFSFSQPCKVFVSNKARCRFFWCPFHEKFIQIIMDDSFIRILPVYRPINLTLKRVVVVMISFLAQIFFKFIFTDWWIEKGKILYFLELLSKLLTSTSTH